MIATALLAATLSEAQVSRFLHTAPAPVRAFYERRINCNHWAGEDAYDEDRGREIAAALRTDRCDRLEPDERRLRVRFRSRADILRLLDVTRDWDGPPG